MASITEERELSFTPAYRLAEMIRSKQLSPVELMEVILRRIKEINPKLNAYLTVVEEEARQAAREAEKALGTGANLGRLHGIPVAIKDLVLTKGMRMTMGSLVYQNLYLIPRVPWCSASRPPELSLWARQTLLSLGYAA